MAREEKRDSLELQERLSEAVPGSITLFDVTPAADGELVAQSADGSLALPLELLWRLAYSTEDEDES